MLKDGFGVAIRLPHDALGLVGVEEPIVLEAATSLNSSSGAPSIRCEPQGNAGGTGENSGAGESALAQQIPTKISRVLLVEPELLLNAPLILPEVVPPSGQYGVAQLKSVRRL